MDILICGYGNIGKHVAKEFNKFQSDIIIYDKYNKNYSHFPVKDHFDYAFVCVPTDTNFCGECITKEVEDVIEKVNGIVDTIIIKSAIPVGLCESLHMSNIVYTPEYWGTTQHSDKDPNFLVIGSSDKHYANKVVQLYSKIKDGSFRFIFTDYKTAELAKYMENSFIATKVTFCNEFYRIANTFGIDYNELRECFVADDRVSPSHTYVYEDAPYYKSHCLDKDIPALITQCEKNNYIPTFLQNVKDRNDDFQYEGPVKVSTGA